MNYLILLIFLCFKALSIFTIASILMHWPTDVFPSMILTSLFILPFLLAVLFVFIGVKDTGSSFVLFNILYRTEIEHADIINVKAGKLNFIYPIVMRSFWVKCHNHYYRHIIVSGSLDLNIIHRLEQMAKSND